MKKISRMIIFSLGAIYLTAFWNKGFIIKEDLLVYIKASLLVALIYYLIRPAAKLILLPLNILTFGLVSVVFYCGLFFFLTQYFSLIQIKDWTFPGIDLIGLTVNKIMLSQTVNIFISSLSVSTIINLEEHII